VTPEDVGLLIAPDAEPLLRRVTEAYAGDVPPDALALSTALRAKGNDKHLVGLALTQGRLRRKAVAKLGARGARLLWTPTALEQATRADVAAHRAERFARLAPRLTADLGCGAGADLLALADSGLNVRGVELDLTTAALARANAAIEGYAIEVLNADVRDLELSGYDAVFVDPARREDGRRRFDPEAWSPAWSWVVALAERVPALAAKVAPGIDHALPMPSAETEWVSVSGDVKDAVVWHGSLASQGIRRRATLLPSGATLTDEGLDVARVGPVGRWLIEPDGAVIRAGLVAAVAAQVDGRLVDKAIAYVVTDTEPVTPYGTTYEVLGEIPFALKRMRAALRAKGYGDVIIKKRGVAVVPEELRRRLSLGGGGPMATVVLTRTSRGPLALLVRRTSATETPEVP
jgi:THUMP domain-like/Methyltransferase domain